MGEEDNPALIMELLYDYFPNDIQENLRGMDAETQEDVKVIFNHFVPGMNNGVKNCG